MMQEEKTSRPFPAVFAGKIQRQDALRVVSCKIQSIFTAFKIPSNSDNDKISKHCIDIRTLTTAGNLMILALMMKMKHLQIW